MGICSIYIIKRCFIFIQTMKFVIHNQAYSLYPYCLFFLYFMCNTMNITTSTITTIKTHETEIATISPVFKPESFPTKTP